MKLPILVEELLDWYRWKSLISIANNELHHNYDFYKMRVCIIPPEELYKSFGFKPWVTSNITPKTVEYNTIKNMNTTYRDIIQRVVRRWNIDTRKYKIYMTMDGNRIYDLDRTIDRSFIYYGAGWRCSMIIHK